MLPMLPTLPILETPKLDNSITLIIKKIEPPKEKLYTIKPGDNLTKIAESQNTTAERLFEANPSISNPNLINASETIKIPSDEEVLTDREMPAIIEPHLIAEQSSPARGAVSVSGNTYSYGYCTWFVKNVRPDLPNNLGNADTWYIRYKGDKGSTPRVGAVAVAKGYMHVALVIGVGEGTVNIREMNYKGWNVVSERVAPISEFNYIY